jgi:hypothetical protein
MSSVELLVRVSLGLIKRPFGTGESTSIGTARDDDEHDGCSLVAAAVFLHNNIAQKLWAK